MRGEPMSTVDGTTSATGGDGHRTFRTGIGASTPDTILLLGQDLAHDLIGQVGFGELAFWLIAKRRPTPAQLTMFEAVLISLADHGFTPTAIAARLTYTSAPESLQGAVAAGLLGGGSRFLGVTEDAARFLHRSLAGLDHRPGSGDEPGWDAVAEPIVAGARGAGRFVPGLGHPVHKVEDPRTPVLFDLARRSGTLGDHLELFAAIGRVHPAILGRTLPLNGAGVCGAVLADLDLPLSVMRGVALLARCAGLLGHLVEEQTDPIGMDVYLGVDRNIDYQPPS
jgi:citrate synthase